VGVSGRAKWPFRGSYCSFVVSKSSVGNFAQALIAVVAGNAVYFLLMPYLPPLARHAPMRLDLGTVVDFWICLVFFGITKTIAGRKRPSAKR